MRTELDGITKIFLGTLETGVGLISIPNQYDLKGLKDAVIMTGHGLKLFISGVVDLKKSPITYIALGRLSYGVLN